MSKVNLVGEFDASKWAKEFVRTVKENPAIATDESTMIGWFANAIMAGYDKDKQERESAVREAVANLKREAKRVDLKARIYASALWLAINEIDKNENSDKLPTEWYSEFTREAEREELERDAKGLNNLQKWYDIEEKS
jgi:CRISPR/Cas system-associated protein Cas5 (RAMP superfamily)